MRFERLLDLVGHLPWFDLATVVQLTGQRRASVNNQLYRFRKAGKILALRRGLFVLAPRYRRTAVQAVELAGVVYRPSYLSGPWALSYYGLIPEAAAVFTSATPRTTRRFENAFGEYVYQSVKQSLFFGAELVLFGDREILVATPEKALIDAWHLSRGKWTAERMRGMRFAPGPPVDTSKLESMLAAIGKPRLVRAYELWRTMVGEEAMGEVEL